MDHPWRTLTRIADERVVAIVRARSGEVALAAARAAVEAGLGVVEVSLTTPDALDVIRDLAGRAGPDVVVGAGTVLDAASARLAVLAGARLLVSPVLCPEVVAVARGYGAVSVPGCATPTEMLAALRAGADLVKLFPASTWRPDDLRQLLAALPQLPVVPTGGVGLADAPAWIDAGAVAVGMASALTAGDPDQVRHRVRQLRAALAAAGGADGGH